MALDYCHGGIVCLILGKFNVTLMEAGRKLRGLALFCLVPRTLSNTDSRVS